MLVECNRCFGKGNISSFSHISNGMCFACNGTGTLVARPVVQEINNNLVDAIHHLVKVENGMSYATAVYVWNKNTKADRYGLGHVFASCVVRGTAHANPMLKCEKNLYEASLDEVRAEYKRYLAMGYKLLPTSEVEAWYENNMNCYAEM